MASHKPIQDLYRHIVRTGNDLMRLSRSSNNTDKLAIDVPPRVGIPLPEMVLPEAPSIYSKILALGHKAEVAAEISQIYAHSVAELRTHTQASLLRACQLTRVSEYPGMKPVSSFSRDLVAAYAETYLRAVHNLESEAVALAVARKTTHPNPVVQRPLFNQDFSPFLGLYFQKNAYPSQADRAIMARKSMMTPRQIEVWFQNHRRRARMEGRPVVRRRPDDRSPIDLEALAQSMPDLFIPEGQRSDIEQSDWDNDDDEMDDLSDEEAVPEWTDRHVSYPGAPDLLDLKAPPHAFPTVFSECRNYHPYPTKDEGFTFSPAVWMRKPATQRVNRPSPDFEDLTTRFEKLSLLTPLIAGSRKAGSGKHSRPTSIEPSSSKRKFPLPTTFTPITPPIGRHPAFVPTPSESRVSPATSKPTIPIVRAPDSRLHAFQTPAPESPPVSLLPPSAPSSSVPVYKKTLPRRQVARLPRRTPQSQSVAHRTSPIQPVTTPSSPSSSPSVSSGSRTSSFESLFSSHTRTSSSGSDTSLPNMPITPTFSPTPLQPPAPVTATDFSFTDDLFGDSLFDLSFPPNAFQLNGFGNAAKQVQAPSYNDFNFNFTPSQFLQA